MRKIIKTYNPLIPIILLCVFYIYIAHDFAVHDFANYYFGAFFIKEGLFTTDIYFPYYFNKTISDFGYQNIFVSYAPNTPFLAIFFYPFSLLPLAISKLIFNSLSSLLFVYSISRLSNYFKIKTTYLLLLPIVFFIPLRNNLLYGQVYFLLFFLLSEGFLALEKKQHKKVAILWSIAIFLKVFPIILAVYLLFKKEFKALRYLIICCVILLTISIAIVGFDVWQFYFYKILPRASNGEIAGAFVDNYQSVFMFLKRLFVFDEIYNPNAISHVPNVVSALLVFFKITLIGLGFYLTKKSKNNLIVFAFWLLITFLLSPYGSTYSFILLIFMFFSIVFFPSKWKILSIILLFLISNSSIFRTFPFPLNYSRLFLMLVFTFILIWNFKEKIRFKIIGILAGVLAITNLIFNNPKTGSIHFSNQKIPILTYDYSIIDAKLNYFYWNENGENTRVLNKKINSSDTTTVKIINNQVYYLNRQITFGNGNKIKPTLINNNQIIFLSDKNRGVGFYDLQKINLINAKEC